MKAYKAAFAAIMAAAALTQGCATVATHYQVRAAYEHEARSNVMRGGRALCAIDGQQKPVSAISIMDMILENWPDYGKALGLDVLAGLVAWYIYDSKDGGTVGDTIVNHNCPDPTAHDGGGADDAGGDDDGGAAE
jgi:hypothetical protein